ncbi:secretin N-terminal domain-containing protein [Bdellovibrionota bacterium]
MAERTLRFLLMISCLIFVFGCATVPTYKDPNVVYLDEIKLISREDTSHVGIFADKRFEYTIEQLSDPSRLVMDIENADSTYLTLPGVPDDDLTLESIEKEQTFNAKGLPTTRITMNLRTEFPFEAMATKYGARVAISATEMFGEDVSPPEEGIEVADAQVPEVEVTQKAPPEVDDLDEISGMSGSDFARLENPEAMILGPVEEVEVAEAEVTQEASPEIDDLDEISGLSGSDLARLENPEAYPTTVGAVTPGVSPGPVTPGPLITEGVRVTGLDVLEMNGSHRFVITTSEPVTLTQQKEPNLFRIKLSNTSISDRLARRIDLSQFESSMQEITPRAEDSSVSFDIALRRDVLPTLSQEGKTIFVDVPRPMIAVVPRPAPTKIARRAPLPAGQYYGEPINLDVQNAKIRDVIQMIAKSSGMNIVSGSSVKGRVTAHLKGIPWDQALDIVLRSHKLGWVHEGNTIRIASLNVLKAQEKYGPFENVVLPLNFAKANDMEKELSSFVGPNGKISKDERTNSLIIRDGPLQVAQMRELVRQLDRDVPAILIEAQFVEASGEFTKLLGVKWAGTASTALEALVGQLSGKGDLYKILHDAEDERIARVVSSPKVTTLINHEVVIKQGSDLAYSAAEGGIDFRPLDVSLKILPRLAKDQTILLSVDMIRRYPSFFDRDSGRKISVGGRGLRNAGVGKEQAKTELKLFDRETTVISWAFPSEDDDDRKLLVFITPRLL